MASFTNTIINNVIDKFDYTKLNFINKLSLELKKLNMKMTNSLKII